MGTSTSYSAPPTWGSLKGQVTRAARGTHSPEAAAKVLRSFVKGAGGAHAVGQGQGLVLNGRAALGVAGRLGPFISDVGSVGLDTALRRVGCEDLVGRPAHEILSGLLDRLGGPASTIDEVDARTALAELQRRYLDDATDATEVEERLNQQVEHLDSLLQEFFGLYAYQVFCRSFFEHLSQRVGEDRANSFLDEIQRYIDAALQNRLAGKSVAHVDWAGAQGASLIKEILESTLHVFEG